MKAGFEKIFFCTGARNHDLLKYFNEAKLIFEFDERMASFKALGLTKEKLNPVAICTTSGTAVSECISAMVEAYYSGLPLVLITGDRPKKLHGTGSPQTIEHEALTRSCRRTYLEINLNELEDLSLDQVEYPLHVNVLVDDTSAHDLPRTIHQDMEAFAHFVSKIRRPLFIFSHEARSMRPLVERFQKTKLSYYAETLSGARDLRCLSTEKKIVELFQTGYFDSVIRIGHTPLSKVWRLIERKPLPVFHFDDRGLPGLSFGEILKMGSSELVNNDAFWKIISGLLPNPVSDDTLLKLDELIAKYPASEISQFRKLNELIPENSRVYLGNSLVVRFFELTQQKSLRVFGNRGVNGIDGQLASAIGLAIGTSEKIYCILGDVTTFYDLSAMRELPPNLHLVIMNNKGGRIFDLLNLDRRIVLEHENHFRDICQGFHLSYSTSLADLGRVQVLELFPDRVEGEKFLSEWNR